MRNNLFLSAVGDKVSAVFKRITTKRAKLNVMAKRHDYVVNLKITTASFSLVIF